MNRWFEFSLLSLMDDILLYHSKCNWWMQLTGEDEARVRLDSLLKHAQDHLDVCGKEQE